jgi:uridine phosphorylase
MEKAMINSPISLKNYIEPGVFTAQQLLNIRKSRGEIPQFPAPETVILCYSARTLHDFIRRRPVRPIKGLAYDLFFIKETKDRLAIAGNFGVGSPATAVLVEELAALHVDRFFSVGLAGSLQPDLQQGDILLCDRAVRDEGTSYHYLEPSRTVDASPDMFNRVGNILQNHSIPYKKGASWTTDAPYRETRQEIEVFQSEGVQTVEMEAAALFAVAQYLHVMAGAAFVISDSLADYQLKISNNQQLIQASLRSVLELTVQAFSGQG